MLQAKGFVKSWKLQKQRYRYLEVQTTNLGTFDFQYCSV